MATHAAMATMDDDEDTKYATDEVSVTSTVLSDQDPDKEYEVQAILSETTFHFPEQPNRPDEQYFLIRWESYPLHRSTWEPRANLLACTNDLIQQWETRRDNMSETQYQNEIRKNEMRVIKAQKNAKANKRRRQEKRAEKRRQLSAQKQSAKHAVVIVDESDGDTSPVPRTILKTRKSTSENTRHGEQVEDELSVKEPRVPRKPSLQQSSSSSDTSGTEDSLLEELTMNPEKPKNPHSKSGRQLRESTVRNRTEEQSQQKQTSSAFSSTLKQKDLNDQQRQAQSSKKFSTTSTGTALQDHGPKNTVSEPRRTRSSAQKTAGLIAAPVQRRGTAADAATAPITAAAMTKDTSASIAPTSTITPKSIASMKKSGSGSNAARSIKMVNEPKSQARKTWQHSDKQFGTLKFRRNAEKRSHVEGTPDPTVLDFVNVTPADLLTKAIRGRPAQLDENPYGRRETRHRRTHEDDTEDDVEDDAENGPLASWEIDKVPLVCFEFRNGGCKFERQVCRFLHRNKDPSGQPYKLGPWDGKVPPKYGRPPLTCLHWLELASGCKTPADDCSFAHVNTGYLPDSRGGHKQIDASELPISLRAPTRPRQPRKTRLTCYFWLRAPRSCTKKAEDCHFFHENTGLLASPEGAPYIEIDITERPRSTLPKYNVPPRTCYFWFKSDRGCTKTSDDCKYAHENTGYLQPRNDGPPISIDPTERPKSEKHRQRPVPRFTCSAWLRELSGCPASADDCLYFHENTGWLPPKDDGDEPIQINPDEQPASSPHRRSIGIGTPRAKVTPDMLTCFLWKHGTCEHGVGCKFQHEDTGIVAEAPNTFRPDHYMAHVDEVGPCMASDASENPPNTISIAMGLDTVPTLAPEADTSDPFSENARLPPAKLLCAELRHKIEKACKLDFTEIFTYNGDENGDVTLERRAFLIFHPDDHVEELELITRWLLMLHVEVFNFWFDGSWDVFKQQIIDGGSGVIITHPDFEYFSEIPGFGEVLKEKVRIWSIGTQESFGYDPQVSTFAAEIEHNRIEIFPHGGFIYITDEVFEHKPQEALKIVELFFAKIRRLQEVNGPLSPWHRVDDACLLWRLCVRPELMEFLFQQCEKHADEVDAGNPFHQSWAKLYELLHRTEYIEQDDSGAFIARPDDYYPILSLRRCIADDYYFSVLPQSQEEANSRMITYYGGLLIDMRRDYRHYFVVHTEPDAPVAKRWKQEIKNIDEIMAPEKCIEYFEQPAKGNRFDFLDWAMNEYRNQGWRNTEVDKDPDSLTVKLLDSHLS